MYKVASILFETVMWFIFFEILFRVIKFVHVIIGERFFCDEKLSLTKMLNQDQTTEIPPKNSILSVIDNTTVALLLKVKLIDEWTRPFFKSEVPKQPLFNPEVPSNYAELRRNGDKPLLVVIES